MKDDTIIEMSQGTDGIFHAVGTSKRPKKEKKQKIKRGNMQAYNNLAPEYYPDNNVQQQQTIHDLLHGVSIGINLLRKLRRL